jgi:hypothetical protein
VQTPESHLAGRLFHGQGRVGSEWKPLIAKSGDVLQHDAMCQALRTAEEVEVSPVVEMKEGEWKRKGLHFPHKIIFRDGVDQGPVTTRMAVFKTVHVHRENKRYCESMDLAVPGPEREVVSYILDRTLGFDLVPPTIGREIEGLGYGSLQAWVDHPTAWKKKQIDGYDYRVDTRNPWLHRLAAFDFIRGEIDRHSNNWIMDSERRVWAIDNGYAFPKGTDRKWYKSNAGKRLIDTPIHPVVRAELNAVDPGQMEAVLSVASFREDEVVRVLERWQEVRELKVWRKLGDLW